MSEFPKRIEPFISNINEIKVDDVNEPTFIDNETPVASEEKLKSDLDLITLHRLGSIKKEQKIINLNKEIENLKTANRSKFLADSAKDFHIGRLEDQISWIKEGIKVHQNKIVEIEQGRDSYSTNQESETVDTKPASNVINISRSELETNPVDDKEVNLGVSELVNGRAANDESYDQIGTPSYTIEKNNVVNLDRSQWMQVQGEEYSDTEQKGPDSSAEDVKKLTSEKSEGETVEKTEYLRLKGEFKNSQREYMQVLEEDYKNRGALKKVFGLGRKEMSPEVQLAYDKFMTANTAYYGFAQESGAYQKIAERINRDRLPEEKTMLGSAVMGRHVFRPAEKRLELQTSHMPEGLINLKEKIIDQVKKHPKAAVAVGAALLVKSAVFSLPALLTGLGTRYAGRKVGDALEGDLFDDKKEIGHLFDDDYELVDSPGIGINLTELEEEVFSKANRLQKVRTGTNWAAAGAGLAAGGVSSFVNAEDGFLTVSNGPEVVPADVISDIQDNINVSEVADSNINVVPDSVTENVDGIFNVERGDTLSTAMLDQIRERVEAGSLQLPKGVEIDNISHYIYQSFPEMTNATGVGPRLSPEEWVEVGVSSGDPQNIQVGESINVQGLIDKMWGQPQEFASPVPEVSPVEAVVENVQNIDKPPTPVEPVVPVEVATTQSSIDAFPSGQEGVAPTETFSQTVTNNVEMTSRDVILAGREASPELIRMMENARGFQPMMNPKLESLITTPDPSKDIIHHVYEHMIKAYQVGDMNIPAERMEYVAGNKTALYSFIEETALELSDKKWFAALNGAESLGLTSAQWQELGFSSGDPQNIVAGDQIQMGKLIKIILEHSAEGINNKG